MEKKSGRRVRDLSTETFGRLHPLEYEKRQSGRYSQIYWLCRCDCGQSEDIWVRSQHLIQGKIKSCGCFRAEESSKRMQTLRAEQRYT